MKMALNSWNFNDDYFWNYQKLKVDKFVFTLRASTWPVATR
jgi:hypothetical protein